MTVPEDPALTPEMKRRAAALDVARSALASKNVWSGSDVKAWSVSDLLAVADWVLDVYEFYEGPCEQIPCPPFQDVEVSADPPPFEGETTRRVSAEDVSPAVSGSALKDAENIGVIPAEEPTFDWDPGPADSMDDPPLDDDSDQR